MTTNEILQQVYRESNLSKTDFAYAIGTEPSRIYSWTNNKEKIKYCTLKTLLNNYGLKVEIKISKL